MQELPQIIVSALVIIGIFVMLALGRIPPDNPFFVGGSSGLLLLVVSYWLSNGHLRLQHTQMMRSIAQVQETAVPQLVPSPEPQPLILPPERPVVAQPVTQQATTTTEPIQLQPQSHEPAHQEGNV